MVGQSRRQTVALVCRGALWGSDGCRSATGPRGAWIMKIALVTDNLGAPAASGADASPVDPASRVLPLARALADQGQQVTVYSRQDSASSDTAPCTDARRAGVTISRIPAGPPERLPT